MNKTTTTTEKRKVFSFMGGTWRVRCPSVLTTTRNIFHWGGWHTLRLYSPPPRRPFLFFFFIVMGTKKKRGRTRRSSSRVASFVNCVCPDFRRHILEFLFLRHLTLFFFFRFSFFNFEKTKNKIDWNVYRLIIWSVNSIIRHEKLNKFDSVGVDWSQCRNFPPFFMLFVRLSWWQVCNPLHGRNTPPVRSLPIRTTLNAVSWENVV